MIYAVLGIIILIPLIIIIWYIRTGNNFKRFEIKIEEAKSGIEVALTKRYDTLTKLLDVAKGYATHEKEVLTEVINLRKGMSVGEMNDASLKMDELSKQINVTAEAYPELRSSEVFVQLQKGTMDTEEHLQAARRLYNSNVTRFNTAITVFPSSIIGKNYAKHDFFEAEPQKRNDVKMAF